ncbi:MAG: hypothetical protein KF895_02945 [Parvibaculum sp.]|nr:hypothetical protein [Parvibaculum sp.]
MATSGTVAFNMTNAEIIDEAFERCGVDPSSLTVRHLKSALRSMNLLFADWANKGVKLWAVEQEELVLTAGDADFPAPAGTVAILEAVLRRSGADTPVIEISRQEWLDIPRKDTQGRVDRFYLERTLTPTVHLWPVPENSTDRLIYNRMRQLEDFAAIADNPDAPARWLDALNSGLAAKLAVKFSPERLPTLQALANTAFLDAKMEERERADTVIRGSYRRGRGR